MIINKLFFQNLIFSFNLRLEGFEGKTLELELPGRRQRGRAGI